MASNTLFVSVAACYAAAATFAEKVDALRVTLKGQRVSLTPKDVKATLAPETARYYGVALVDKVRGEGQTWGADTASQTAKKQNDRLTAAVIGDAKGETEAKPEIEIPAELLAAAAKLAKLAQQYEGARSLASKALAHAFSA